MTTTPTPAPEVEALIERLSRECATLMDGNANRWTVVQPFFIQFAAELPASRRIKELEAERNALMAERDAYALGVEAEGKSNWAARDKLETVVAQRDLLYGQVERLRGALERYRNETPLGHQPEMIAHEVDALLKETSNASD